MRTVLGFGSLTRVRHFGAVLTAGWFGVVQAIQTFRADQDLEHHNWKGCRSLTRCQKQHQKEASYSLCQLKQVQSLSYTTRCQKQSQKEPSYTVLPGPGSWPGRVT